MNFSEATPAAEWNYQHVAVALAIGLITQMVVLPCLCPIGTVKITFALVFDAMVLVRLWVAKRRRETGRGWIAYAVLCYTSAGWIEGAAFLLLGET